MNTGIFVRMNYRLHNVRLWLLPSSFQTHLVLSLHQLGCSHQCHHSFHVFLCHDGVISQCDVLMIINVPYQVYILMSGLNLLFHQALQCLEKQTMHGHSVMKDLMLNGLISQEIFLYVPFWWREVRWCFLDCYVIKYQ